MTIKNVLAITPVWNEPLEMIQRFRAEIDEIRPWFASRAVAFTHLFLDDSAPNLPEEYPRLVRHKQNLGLAQTLLDGYTEVFELREVPDVVIRLDCQEHDASMIPRIVEHFERTAVDAICLPVWYWVEGQLSPPMRDISRLLADFAEALHPINEEVVLATYNQKFPMGYQAYRSLLLKQILPNLRRGAALCEEITGQRTSWGLDLLAILLAARTEKLRVDFLFGGWSTPWGKNRGTDKVRAQQERARTMVEVMRRL